MCHLILMMPVIALPVFWLLPPVLSVPIYAVVVLISGLLYWMITRAMRRPISTGVESLLGTSAQVISRSNQPGPLKYMVRAGGELWTATSPSSLHLGEQVEITAVDGVRLMVEPAGNSRGEKNVLGVKADERNCH